MTPDLDHPTPEELFAYRDGELPADKRALLEAHVTSCRACREQIDRVSGLEAAMRQRPDPVEGDYYAALSRSVLRKIGAKETAAEDAAASEPVMEAGPPARGGAPARPEAPPRERRRERGADEPRPSRAPGLPWAPLISTMAAASAVVVVIVMLFRQGGIQNQNLATAPRAAAPLGGAPVDSSTSGREGAPAGDLLAARTPASESKGTEAPPGAAFPPTGASSEAPSTEAAAGAARPDAPPAPKQQVALGSGEDAVPGGVADRLARAQATRQLNEPLPPEQLSGGAFAKDEDRARASAEAESKLRSKAAAPQVKGLAVGGVMPSTSPYQSLVRRFGLPDVWSEGAVPRDALLRAEPDLRILYIAGGAGADSARVRLYLAEAGRLRYESEPDSALFDSIVHHYWRAIRLAGDQPGVARVARARLESFSR
jgi:Putative zinc-finger